MPVFLDILSAWSDLFTTLPQKNPEPYLKNEVQNELTGRGKTGLRIQRGAPGRRLAREDNQAIFPIRPLEMIAVETCDEIDEEELQGILFLIIPSGSSHDAGKKLHPIPSTWRTPF